MVTKAQIEINASPEECRRIFLDFENWTKIKSDMIKNVSRIPADKTGPIEKGEKLWGEFMGGMSGEIEVMENTTSKFVWKAESMYIMGGLHTFEWEESKTTKGATAFKHDEIAFRLSKLVMWLGPATKMFERFCKDYKERVESVVKEGGEREGRVSV